MMSDTLVHLHGVPVLDCAPDGAQLRGTGDVLDVIGNAIGHGAELVLLPVQRLTDDFFTLRTGLAGEIVQKFANYRIRLAVVGDISPHVAKSSALSAFVSESSRGGQLWFVPTKDDLAERLRQQRRPAT
ncbi:MAG TPA: DUF4180 domain-containing protein [Streptosporangiaceae bacterium]|nr:DUF4180 domain-containing protein [Streptosporangiaceae bacterium]